MQGKQQPKKWNQAAFAAALESKRGAVAASEAPECSRATPPPCSLLRVPSSLSFLGERRRRKQKKRTMTPYPLARSRFFLSFARSANAVEQAASRLSKAHAERRIYLELSHERRLTKKTHQEASPRITETLAHSRLALPQRIPRHEAA